MIDIVTAILIGCVGFVMSLTSPFIGLAFLIITLHDLQQYPIYLYSFFAGFMLGSLLHESLVLDSISKDIHKKLKNKEKEVDG